MFSYFLAIGLIIRVYIDICGFVPTSPLNPSPERRVKKVFKIFRFTRPFPFGRGAGGEETLIVPVNYSEI
jgi:hypothetical protein